MPVHDWTRVHAGTWHAVYLAWIAEIPEFAFRLSPDEPLVQASYSAGRSKVAYVEPAAVGKELIEMPLFLTPERYVPVPLQETYDRAYAGLPKRWQRVLEGSES